MGRPLMHDAPKVKVGFALDADLVLFLSEQAKANNLSRSQQTENFIKYGILRMFPNISKEVA